MKSQPSCFLLVFKVTTRGPVCSLETCLEVHLGDQSKRNVNFLNNAWWKNNSVEQSTNFFWYPLTCSSLNQIIFLYIKKFENRTRGPGFESASSLGKWHWAVALAIASPYQGVKLGQGLGLGIQNWLWECKMRTRPWPRNSELTLRIMICASESRV